MLDEPGHERLAAIKILLQREWIGDQEALVQNLKEQWGIETNQSVVSRDLRKLGVIKRKVEGKLRYELPDLDITTEILKLGIVDILHNEMMIVIKTRPGLAPFIGDCIDHLLSSEILGCLAGENVIFIACHAIQKIEETYRLVCEKLHFAKPSLKE